MGAGPFPKFCSYNIEEFSPRLGQEEMNLEISFSPIFSSWWKKLKSPRMGRLPESLVQAKLISSYTAVRGKPDHLALSGPTFILSRVLRALYSRRWAGRGVKISPEIIRRPVIESTCKQTKTQLNQILLWCLDPGRRQRARENWHHVGAVLVTEILYFWISTLLKPVLMKIESSKRVNVPQVLWKAAS